MKQILLPEEKLKDSEANALRTNCFYPILFSKCHELLFWCCRLADQIIQVEIEMSPLVAIACFALAIFVCLG